MLAGIAGKALKQMVISPNPGLVTGEEFGTLWPGPPPARGQRQSPVSLVERSVFRFHTNIRSVDEVRHTLAIGIYTDPGVIRRDEVSRG